MSSTSLDTRNRQKAEAEARLGARRAKLAETGLDEKKIEKDPIYRNLKSELTKANRRLAAIKDQEERIQKAAEGKGARAKAKKAGEKPEKGKKKKSADKGKKDKKAKKPKKK